jgi:hypothetical protein
LFGGAVREFLGARCARAEQGEIDAIENAGLE